MSLASIVDAIRFFGIRASAAPCHQNPSTWVKPQARKGLGHRAPSRA
jgi:hypothetical protein